MSTIISSNEFRLHMLGQWVEKTNENFIEKPSHTIRNSYERKKFIAWAIHLIIRAICPTAYMRRSYVGGKLKNGKFLSVACRSNSIEFPSIPSAIRRFFSAKKTSQTGMFIIDDDDAEHRMTVCVYLTSI